MNSQHDHGSHLFLIRFWSEGVHEAHEAKDGQEGKEAHNRRDYKDWHGRVQHVLSGEAHTFHDWPTLLDLLLEMAETDEVEAGVPDGSGKNAPSR